MKNIRETVMKIQKQSDFEIYMHMLDVDISAHNLDKTIKEEIVHKSMAVAEDIYHDLIGKYGQSTPAKYCAKLNIPVDFVYEKPNKYYTYIGLFNEKTKSIALNSETIIFIKKLIKDYNLEDLVDSSKIKSVVTAHELFHYFELIYPDLYTNQKIIDAKIFGIFKTKSRLLVAGEVAAMHFAKLLTNLEHSPLVYDRIFSIGKKQLL